MMDLQHVARILVVDDEEDIRIILRARLEAEGFEVQTAENGLEALTRARAWRPDLIVLDLMLPGIDGFSVCAMLKRDRQFSHIPILILSARSQLNDIQTGKTVGADDYLTKPFTTTGLLERINRLLSSRHYNPAKATHANPPEQLPAPGTTS